MEARALGKGLSALIPENEDKLSKSEGVGFIKTNLIKDHTLQPRTHYRHEALEELKASIKEKGILQPLIVRKIKDGYEVVAGERRLRAARELNLPEVPVVIKNVSDEESFVIALIENIQREELDPIEEAQAYRKLIDNFSYTQETVAKSVGRDRSTVANLLRVLNLPTEIQEKVSDGTITIGHARTFLAIDSIVERMQLFHETVKKQLSVRALENLVKNSQAAPAHQRRKNTSNADAEIIALEEDLRRVLGTKVKLMASKKRGKLVIEYYSLDDLDRIIRIIKK
jgi:ParB family chromosome partitioning protein